MAENENNDVATLDDDEATQQDQIDDTDVENDESEDQDVADGADEAGDETPESADSVSDEIDESLLERAESYGVDRSRAEALGSNEAIEAMLDAVDSAVRRSGSDQTQQQNPGNNGASRSQSADAPEELPELKLELDVDDIGEANHKALQKFAGDVGAQIKVLASERDELRKEVALAKGIATQTSGELASTRLLQQVDKLGDEWTQVLGKGHVRQESTQHKNRVKLANEMVVYLKGIEATNGPTPSLESLFDRALRSAFPRKTKNIAETATRRAAQDRHSQVIGAPAHSRKPKAKKNETEKVFESLDKLASKNPGIAAMLKE